jgi:hypothetical protein
MGATAKSPAGISGNPPSGRGASDFYANALSQQKQAVANVPSTQAAQAAPGVPPNRPEPSFLNQPAQTATGRPTPNQQAPGSGSDDQYAQAYAAYMQRSGGVGMPGERPQQPASPGEASQQFAGFGAPTTAQRQQSGPPPRLNAQQMQEKRKGITMGGGYASRSFG